MRVAGAPISWGVCEVPGWGFQLDADRVLREMRALGLVATEFGPDGFLPDPPPAKSAVLSAAELAAVGGFVPVVLQDGHDTRPEIAAQLDGFVAAGASTLVLAAATGQDGYDARPVLSDPQWDLVLGGLDAIAEQAAERGVRAVLHPHVGTVVERADEVARVLDGSAIGLCVDTGHLSIGGTDPVELVREATDRVHHVHLKDVDESTAARVRQGELTYYDAVRAGLYRPLGAGDVDIAALVRTLESAGYDGWYVLEQDTVLDAEPTGEGPMADVRASLEYLRSVA